jgi:hypothetical protein
MRGGRLGLPLSLILTISFCLAACSGFRVVDGGPGDSLVVDGPTDAGIVYRDLPTHWLTDARAENGLHPALMISPALRQETCKIVSSPTVPCAEGEACAFYTAAENRCAYCPIEKCGEFDGVCSLEKPCRPFYTCFGGFCMLACPLADKSMCGNPDDCLDIGHPDRGVCARLTMGR